MSAGIWAAESIPSTAEIIKLNVQEMILASLSGLVRNAWCVRKGLPHKQKPKRLAEAQINHLMGAHGEVALAKWYGIKNFVPTCGTFSGKEKAESFGFKYVKGDVAGTEARTKDGTEMLIRQKDEDGLVFVKIRPVQSDFSEMAIIGWTFGECAKKAQYQIPGEPPAYFFPDSKLNPPNQKLRELANLGDALMDTAISILNTRKATDESLRWVLFEARKQATLDGINLDELTKKIKNEGLLWDSFPPNHV